MLDTSFTAEQRYFQLLSEKSPIERLSIALGLTRSVRELAATAVSNEHPGATTEELRAHLAERLYGRSVADRLFRRT